MSRARDDGEKLTSSTLECLAIPAAEVCRRLVGGLEELEQRRIRRRGLAHARVRQDELAEVGAVESALGPHLGARHDESRTLAKTIQAQLHHSLKRVNPRLENRGVKTAPFVVLIGTQMPAILVEISVLSNDEEVKLLTKEHYRENIALALLQGIKNYARNFNVPERKGN